MQRIPWCQPRLTGLEHEYVADALRSTWISGGPYVDRLETEVSDLLGVAHAFACSSGTAALELTYLALGLPRGSEIILPAFGYLAAANAAIRYGLIPKFADVEEGSWCLDPESVQQLLAPSVSAIVAIDTYGSVCSMPRLRELSAEQGVWLIEDAAEAFGSTLKDGSAGALGDIGTLSFQATKTITSGEGGMVLTDNSQILDAIRLYRSHGTKEKKYFHVLPGANFRLSNVQAAIACAQLKDFDAIRAERERVSMRYEQLLGEFSGVTLQRDNEGVRQLPWAVAVRLSPAYYPQGRDVVITDLDRAGIEVRPGFYPASVHPYLRATPLPVADLLAAQVIVLPTFPELSDEAIDYVAETLVGLSEERLG